MIRKIILILLICFALVGCSQESTAEDAMDRKVEAKTESKKTHLEFKGKEEIAIFEKAVSDSVKVPGIVNVSSPMFTFSIGEDFYFLWITEESGSIMNRKDDHTLYTLSNSSVKEVYQYVNKE